MVARGLSTLDDLEKAERQEVLTVSAASSVKGVASSSADPSSRFD